MRFGKTLQSSIYEPWKDQYMDYAKLKALLREDKDGDKKPWTEDDESRFSDEIFTVQLEKVAKFQADTLASLQDRTDDLFAKIKEMSPEGEGEGKGKGKEKSEITAQRLKGVEGELEKIIADVKELKKYSSFNYTGFLKIVKKHDRKRGSRYRMRPMMLNSLAKRPFNSEKTYSPLLAKLSLMYAAIHQYLNEDDTSAAMGLDGPQPIHQDGEVYTAHKFFVHPDNLLEVKTMILRHLPALIYSDSSATEADAGQDPVLTSLYLDNNQLDLFAEKTAQREDPTTSTSSSLRLRWFGQLSSKPEIFLEHKIIHPTGESEEHKLVIKDKYVQPFLNGEYKMEKSIEKLERQGMSKENVEAYKATVDKISNMVQERNLQPLVRANYVRTAYQKPGDERVRISLDTDLAFIREDTLDDRRPCRDPKEWHRRDIDSRNLTYPFSEIASSDISRFPYAVLEIKVKEQAGRKQPSFVKDLMNSYLVYRVSGFSKFILGVAALLEDNAAIIPEWVNLDESEVRRDIDQAHQEDQERKAQLAEGEQAVGSLLGSKGTSFKPVRSSPVAKSFMAERLAAEASGQRRPSAAVAETNTTTGGQLDGDGEGEPSRKNYGTLMPSFNLTKYAQWRRQKEQEQLLPEGVYEPEEWLKNKGELKIEPKVWLANERTFLKWQHIAVLLGSLAVALYTKAGHDSYASFMGIAYLVVAVFVAGWGRYVHYERQRIIRQRSGEDMDFVLGPVVVIAALLGALILNFVFAYREAFERWDQDDSGLNETVTATAEFVGELL